MRKGFPLSAIAVLLIVANPALNLRASDPPWVKEPGTQRSVSSGHHVSRGGAANPIQRLTFEDNIATYDNGSLILGGYLGPLENQHDSRFGTAANVSRSAPATSRAGAAPHFRSPVRSAQSQGDVEIKNLLVNNPFSTLPPGSANPAAAPKHGEPQINPYVIQSTEGAIHTTGGAPALNASGPSSTAVPINRLGPADLSRSTATALNALTPPHFTSPVRIAQSEESVENLLVDNPYVPERHGNSKTEAPQASKPVEPQINPYVRQSPEGGKQETGGGSAPSASASNAAATSEPVNQPEKNRRNLRFPDQPPPSPSTPVDPPTPVEPPRPAVKPPAANTQTPVQPTPVEAPSPAVDAPAAQEQSPAPGPAAPQQPSPSTESSPSQPPPSLRDRYQPAPDENLLHRGDEQQLPADRGLPTDPGTPTDRGDETSRDQPKANKSGADAGDVEKTEPLFTAPPASSIPPRQETREAVPAPNGLRQNSPPANELQRDGMKGTQPSGGTPAAPVTDPHYEVFAKSQFPSAKECAVCHKQIFEEWSASSHAYAAISPMFQRFEQTISSLTKGTIGYFCMRCHSPVGTTINHPRWKSIWESIPAATEGVTCIVCHRVWQDYGKVNGERRIEPGDIFSPVTGAGYGYTLQEILQKKEHYKVKTSPADKGPGQNIHTQVVHFEQISKSEFCVSCHQVTVYPGIALEVVWAQYRASPACKAGISCQDCHMGSVPGQAQGYDTAPVAVVGDKEIDPGRKHSNHTFYGPGYSIAHPGIFPFRAKQDEEWTPQQWQQFDYRAGWGTERFEEAVDNGMIQGAFPAVWENTDDRADAREILDKSLAKLAYKSELRRQLMEYNSNVEGPFFKRTPAVNKLLKFHYVIRNLNSGHNMPSGSLGAQPQLWLNVALTGPDGGHLWESGYVDANGDIADLHSFEVAAGRIRPDRQLVNLQTKFLIANTNGPDREFYLPVAVDVDPLPFIRPAGLPISVLNHPPLIRMEAHSVPPLGQRVARYHVPAGVINRPGVYRLSVRMRSRAEPIYFMKFCRSTPEMERNMNERMLNFHEESFEFVVQ